MWLIDIDEVEMIIVMQYREGKQMKGNDQPSNGGLVMKLTSALGLSPIPAVPEWHSLKFLLFSTS